LVRYLAEATLQFWTTEQCKRWSDTRWQPDTATSKFTLRVPYSNYPSRMFHIARWMANRLPWDCPSLLWVTASDIGPLSNWHLYYRLRESYGDRREIDEAPGHYCLDHERAELATWIYIAMLSDWNAVLIPELDYARVKFGHYRLIDCYSDDEQQIKDLHEVLVDAEPAAK
jgi:hypothetical protein